MLENWKVAGKTRGETFDKLLIRFSGRSLARFLARVFWPQNIVYRSTGSEFYRKLKTPKNLDKIKNNFIVLYLPYMFFCNFL